MPVAAPWTRPPVPGRGWGDRGGCRVRRVLPVRGRSAGAAGRGRDRHRPARRLHARRGGPRAGRRAGAAMLVTGTGTSATDGTPGRVTRRRGAAGGGAPRSCGRTQACVSCSAARGPARAAVCRARADHVASSTWTPACTAAGTTGSIGPVTREPRLVDRRRPARLAGGHGARGVPPFHEAATAEALDLLADELRGAGHRQTAGRRRLRQRRRRGTGRAGVVDRLPCAPAGVGGRVDRRREAAGLPGRRRGHSGRPDPVALPGARRAMSARMVADARAAGVAVIERAPGTAARPDGRVGGGGPRDRLRRRPTPARDGIEAGPARVLSPGRARSARP